MLALYGKLKAELEGVGTSEHGPAGLFNYSTWKDDVSPPCQRAKHFGMQLKSTLISDRQNRHAGDVDTAPNRACSENMYIYQIVVLKLEPCACWPCKKSDKLEIKITSILDLSPARWVGAQSLMAGT